MNRLCRVVVIIAAATLAWSQTGKYAGHLPPVGREGAVDVIVRYRTPPNQQTLTRLDQYRATRRRDLGLLHSSAITIPAAELDKLAADPEVESIAPDLTIAATDFNGQPDYGWMTAMSITSPRATLPYD